MDNKNEKNKNEYLSLDNLRKKIRQCIKQNPHIGLRFIKQEVNRVINEFCE